MPTEVVILLNIIVFVFQVKEIRVLNHMRTRFCEENCA